MITLSADVAQVSRSIEMGKHISLTGRGCSPCHHGELIQGIFEEQNGVRTRGLVTLVHGHLESRARFIHSSKSDGLNVFPRHKEKARKAALLTLKHLEEEPRGTIWIESSVEEELGLGSSTADVIASCRAVADAFGKRLSREQIARIAVESEFASDPLMYESSTVLFAQREGRVIEELGPLIPSVGIVSFTLGASVNTCTYKAPDYTWEDLQDFKPLIGLLRYALSAMDLEKIGYVATQSAVINQKYLPKPNFEAVLDIARTCSLLGVQIAHSGNLVGLMVSPRDPDLTEKIADARHKLSEIGVEKVRYFEKG